MLKVMAGVFLGLGIVFLAGSMPGRVANAVPTTGDRPTRVALVDMAKIFKTSRAFESKRDALKRKIAESTETVKTMAAEIQQKKKRWETLERGSDERAELEEELKSKVAEFEKFRHGETQRFQKIESEIYREVYDLASEEITGYAKSHEIDLVLRFNSEPIDEDPQKALQGMNRQIVYENGLDITEEIIAALK